jgi:NAD(P)-dependent dehydrogenase (short-subunit alcohol dehydrogenase family)
VEGEQGQLDLLVNNAYGGGDEQDLAERTRFWEDPLASRWDNLFVSGLRSHLAASGHAARMMVRRGQGLIVTTSYYAYDKYMVNLYYDVAMTANNRAAFGMGQDLRSSGVAAVALAPGFMRTELVEASYHGDQDVLESTLYIGRAVVALASDPQVLKKTGQTLFVADLAREYQFTDIDGRQPPPYASRQRGD